MKNSFPLEWEPYTIAAVLDESVSDAPTKLSGSYIDLLDKGLPTLARRIIRPGEQGYLYNIDRVPSGTKAKVLCSAPRIYGEKIGKRSCSFVAKSPLHATNISRTLLLKQLRRACVNGKEEFEPGKLREEHSGILLLRFENDPTDA